LRLDLEVYVIRPADIDHVLRVLADITPKAGDEELPTRPPTLYYRCLT